MDYTIRNMCQNEYPLLEEFLYQAIYVPEGYTGKVPRSILHDDPKCNVAFDDLGLLGIHAAY